MPNIGILILDVGGGQGLLGDPVSLAAEDDGRRLGEVQAGVGDRVGAEMGDRDGEAPFFQPGQAGLGRGVKIHVQPFVGPGGDGVVDGHGVVARADDVDAHEPRRVARPQHGAGVVGVVDLLQDDAQVRLAEAQDALDPGQPFGCGHEDRLYG